MSISRVKPAGYSTGEKLTSAEINQLDTNVTHALDKRAGQTDTLESVITVGGEGQIALTDGASIYLTDSGCVVDADANGAYIQASFAGAKLRTISGGRLELADNDYPQLSAMHTGRTQVRIALDGPWISVNAGTNTFLPGDYTVNLAQLTVNATSGTFVTVNTADNVNSRVAVWILDSVVPNGATITSVSVPVTGYSGHAGMPVRMPTLRVATTTGYPLHSSGSVITDGSLTTSAYQAQHTLTATCDQNNVVDKGTQKIVATLGNEGGTNALAGLQFGFLKVTYNLADIRPF